MYCWIRNFHQTFLQKLLCKSTCRYANAATKLCRYCCRTWATPIFILRFGVHNWIFCFSQSTSIAKVALPFTSSFAFDSSVASAYLIFNGIWLYGNLFSEFLVFSFFFPTFGLTFFSSDLFSFQYLEVFIVCSQQISFSFDDVAALEVLWNGNFQEKSIRTFSLSTHCIAQKSIIIMRCQNPF